MNWWLILGLVLAVMFVPVIATYVAILRRAASMYPPEPCTRHRQRQPRRRSIHHARRPRRRAGRSTRARMLRARIGGVR